MEDLKPHGHTVISADGSPASDMPFDVADKTVAQLKEMGFKEVMNVDVRPNPRKQGLPPRLDADEREDLRKSFSEFAGDEYGSGDEDDSDYSPDEMRDRADDRSLQSPGSTNRGRAENRPPEARLRKLRMQQKIDDARIALVHEALTKGVELEGNDLYYEMLDHYPYYQKILSTRK